ncbi:hypothetical protein CEXT_780691 [Caerostris extrusa]|uniref:Uncharacterized protein n=1 Tax=Caerostris extrusa TaxID=172846 RepID=A0AAV4TRP7_CAEEX|nr:hypothetical protein CEXT_780691 [Caerostris extrusa]
MKNHRTNRVIYGDGSNNNTNQPSPNRIGTGKEKKDPSLQVYTLGQQQTIMRRHQRGDHILCTKITSDILWSSCRSGDDPSSVCGSLRIVWSLPPWHFHSSLPFLFFSSSILKYRETRRCCYLPFPLYLFWLDSRFHLVK